MANKLLEIQSNKKITNTHIHTHTQTHKHTTIFSFQNFSVLIEFVQPKILGQTHGFSLEHLNSVSMNLLCNETLPSNSSEEIVMFSMYNIAHHFMHCFIPKRSFFTGFRPFPFELAPIVDSIWFAEGWAQYLALNAISPLSTKPKKYHECMMNERFKLVLNESPNLIKQMSLTYLSQIASTQYSLDFRIGGASFSRFEKKKRKCLFLIFMFFFFSFNF